MLSFQLRALSKKGRDALAELHPDFFTLRRELVGLGLPAREKGVYGRVTEDPIPQTADDVPPLPAVE